MRKKWFALFLTGVMAVMVTGCGGEHAGRTEEDAVSGGAVSGGAVSGQAVSGGAVSDPTVSGPAVSEKETDVDEHSTDEEYRFCNDSHLYYMEDGVEPVIEYDLSDGSRREIKFKKGERKERIGAICYVDNDWVWYVKEFDPNEIDATRYQPALWQYQTELWRAPVENGKLNAQKEEFVFSDPHVMNKRQIYCDGRYLLYTTDKEDLPSYYRKYDLKDKKYIYNVMPEEDEDEDVYDELIAVTGGVAFIDADEGVFRQELDSPEKVMVTEEDIGPWVAVTEEDLFYGDFEDLDTEEESFHVWQYHLEDGSKKEIITDEQIRKVLKMQGLLKSDKRPEMTADIFVSGDRLYVQIDLYWKENGVSVSKSVVLSQKIGNKGELRYEKGLTECLANPEKNQKKFEKIYDEDEEDGEVESLFLSRGTCLYMSENKCFMALYDPEQDKNRVACYDLSSGSMKFLTKKDPDWYVPFYDGGQPGWNDLPLEEISLYMPNNKKVDWPYCCEDSEW